MMDRIYFPLLLLFLLVAEGVAFNFLPTNLVVGDWIITPHWLLVMLVLIAIFYDLENTYFSVLYALLFGILIDIVYTNVLGVYMFSYGLIVYIIHGLRKLVHTNAIIALLFTLIAISLADVAVYIIYFFIGTSTILWDEYLTVRLLPTLVANSLFFIIIYPFSKGKLVKWSKERYEKAKPN